MQTIETDEQQVEPPIYAKWEDQEYEGTNKSSESVEPRIIVFDLETQRSAAEVGGWNNAHLMGMSVGVVWDSRKQKCTSYFEDTVGDLINHIKSADLVVGFNINGFDYSVLRGYSNFDFTSINTLDILQIIHQRLRYRVSLDSIGKATLNATKTADGLAALKWYKDGKIDRIENYCKKDVELTRDLFYHTLEEGYLLFDKKNEGRMRISLDWDLEKLTVKDAK